MTKSKENAMAINIGRSIAQYRLKQGLTQEWVAANLGIGNEAVSRIERGIATPSIQRLYEFAELFKCQAIDLLTEGSSHIDDQTRHLKQILQELDDEDRELVLRMVEQLSARLAK